MPTLEEIQDETVRATNLEKEDDWVNEDSDTEVSLHVVKNLRNLS